VPASYTFAAVSVERADAGAARAELTACAAGARSNILPGTNLPPAANEQRP
jgi:hypothetical protein